MACTACLQQQGLRSRIVLSRLEKACLLNARGSANLRRLPHGGWQAAAQRVHGLLHPGREKRQPRKLAQEWPICRILCSEGQQGVM